MIAFLIRSFVFFSFFLSSPIIWSQTNGDAVIFPSNYIGNKIEHFFYDIKGWPGSINNTSIASDLFVTDDMNGIRISIYGDATRPAHPEPGVVIESYYEPMLNSLARAKAARGDRDFSIFASKKLDGRNTFPAWTKNSNGVIVAEYVKLLTDYFLFMKSKGYEIDYLGIQNEEEYNEGNITPAKHKAIIDSLRVITQRIGVKMPLIIGYEGYGPNKNNNWMQNMKNNGWLDRMDIYGTHYYPHLRPINNLKADLAHAGNMPFWSTEPHWQHREGVDDFNQAEQAMCALWDQVEVGMSAFMWWNYKRSGSLRGNLMRHASVPLKDARMIDMDDVDGRNTFTYGRLQTRAFREDNTITVYAINNHASNIYENYGFGLHEGVIASDVNYTQWIKGEAIIGSTGKATIESNLRKFRLTIPAFSITVFSFEIDPSQKDDTILLHELFSSTNGNVVYNNESLNDVLSTQGWEIAESFASGSASNRFNFKTIAEGGYLLSPELDIPSGTAIELNMVARMVQNDIGGSDTELKRTNNLHRNFYMVIGNDTVYDHQKVSAGMANPLFQNFNRFMGTYIYDGPNPARVKFLASNTYQDVWEDKQDGMVMGNNTGAGNNTGVLIRQLTDTIPAINIAYGQHFNLGDINMDSYTPGSVYTATFPLKGVNLRQNVVFDDTEATRLSLPVKTFSPIHGKINTWVSAEIEVPALPGTYSAKVTVAADGFRASGVTNSAQTLERTVWLTYSVGDFTSVNSSVANQVYTYVSDRKIQVRSSDVIDVAIYNISGMLLKKFEQIESVEVDMPSGVYIVKAGSKISKIIL